jgi:SAM-dependent MidA family methyltransferase
LSAAAEIRAAIAAAGGAIPFSAFLELALYGEDGYYTGRDERGSAGRRGDFLTSPEVGPLFGAVLARFLDDEWERIGRPDPFLVVDAGAGPGTLARSVLAATLRCRPALRYVAVERSDRQRRRHPSGVESRPELPNGPFDGVVIANELLDNLPFRLVVHDDGWREAYVAEDGAGGFAEVLSAPLHLVPDVLPPRAPLGARAPLVEGAAGWVADASERLRRGAVVAFDYVRPTTAELIALDHRRWLRTYRGHEPGAHYLRHPGCQDITTDLPADQLPPADAVRSQAQFLERWGIGELVDEGVAAWAAAAHRPDLRAITMRSRVREAEALTDAAGLGGFTVLEWHR